MKDENEKLTENVIYCKELIKALQSLKVTVRKSNISIMKIQL